MKKFLLLTALNAGICFAQTQIETYSVYDVNHKDGTTVADATMVVNRAIEAIQSDPQVVDASILNELLQSIDRRLEENNNLIRENNQRLARIMQQSNMDYPYDNLHEYVDLGVVVDGKPVYWATTNIGAELPADYGLYFAWGETTGYTEDANDGRRFDWASYSSDLCGGASNKLKKYCTDSSYGAVDNKTVLDPEEDAAHVNWQGKWRMPTRAEQEALRNQCSWIWTTMTNSDGKSVNGYKVSNKRDSSKYIFLPAAGYRGNSDLTGAGSYGYYWSSSLYESSPRSAYCLYFYSGYVGWNSSTYRDYGLSVRPVRP